MTILRRHGVLALALPLLAALYLWLSWYDGLGSVRGDGLIYFLTAWQYAPWVTPDPLAAAIARATLFPPVYPLMLMASGAIYGFQAAHVVTAGLLLVSFVAFHAWLVSLGVSRARAGACAALFGLLPGTLLQSFYLHPEGLYVALVFTAFVLLDAAERTQRAGWFWGASAIIAIALVTRTAGVTLVPALALVLVRNRPAGWPAMLAAAVAPAVAWGLLHHPEMAYSEVLTGKYNTERALGDMARDVASYVAAAIDGLSWNIVRMASLRGPGLGLCAVAFGIGLWRFARGKVDAWYVMAYLGMMALWPYPQEDWRLMWVLAPIVLGYLCWGGERLAGRAAAVSPPVRAAMAWGPLLAIALVVVPGALLFGQRALQAAREGEPALRHIPEWYHVDPAVGRQAAQRQLEIIRGLRQFQPLIPEDALVCSTLPLAVAFYIDRLAHNPPLDDARFENELQRQGCRYFLMLAAPSRKFGPYYPRDRLGDRIRIIGEHRMPGADPASPPELLLGVLEPG